ncbi:MAG: hypothetical protein ABWK53_12195 [Anaerolineales bacterium]
MTRIHLVKILSGLLLTALLALTFAAPVSAAESRQGDHIVIAADEVVADDLYVFADTFTLDGTIQGDLVVFASLVTVNGTVEGDLMAAAQTVIINGQIADDVRAAGAVIFVGAEGRIGDDLMSACSSLETRPGSVIAGDLMGGGTQALLAGEVGGNVKIGANGLEVRGTIGGDVEAYVGEASQEYNYLPPMPEAGIAAPIVGPGLTLSPQARIAGDLNYVQSADLDIPSGVVNGTVTRTPPRLAEQDGNPFRGEREPRTAAEKVGVWFLELLRRSITLILIGLLLAWLAPGFVPGLGRKIETRPLPSLGWGLVAGAAFWFALLVILLAVFLLTLLFASLTLSGLAAASALIGFLLMVELVIAFVLVSAWLTYLVIGTLIGRLILNAVKPGLGEHRIWPMLVGVVLLTLAVKLPGVGWLVGLFVVLFGLGAIWLQGREALRLPSPA